jgi:hypothetical protein
MIVSQSEDRDEAEFSECGKQERLGWQILS